jgi:acetyl-CoA carboxylase biotin carboxylase subunit
MSAAGVPIVPGARCETTEEATEAAKKIGFPVMLKAASGGGGKGMRLVANAGEMASAWERARSEAKKFFGDDTVYIEKAIIKPRHVEIQVLGDREGNLVHVFERDCSIQRRNQKVVEETPSPAASRDLVARMGAIAVQGAKSVGYFSAGTFEFLLAEDGSFYFLEMNTRLQVEHPVTELIYGLDLVSWQLDVADGKPLPLTQAELDARRRGWAIECRVYAEDPVKFLPSPGTITHLRVPDGPYVRDDSGCYEGAEIPVHYDPLISKLVVWGEDRERALARMRRALDEYQVRGIETNLPFHRRCIRHPAFCAGDFDTGFIARNADALHPRAEADELVASIAAAVIDAHTGAHHDAPASAAARTTTEISAWRRGL